MCCVVLGGGGGGEGGGCYKCKVLKAVQPDNLMITPSLFG